MKKTRGIQKIIAPILIFEINTKAEKQLVTFSDRIIQNADFKKKSLLKKCLLQVLEASNEEDGTVTDYISTDLGMARVVVNGEKFVLTITPENGEYELHLEMEIIATVNDPKIVERVINATWHLI